jgi:hypothetical protein
VKNLTGITERENLKLFGVKQGQFVCMVFLLEKVVASLY